jgi:hypothetical protein
MLVIIKEVEAAVVAYGSPESWPPLPEFSMDLLEALAAPDGAFDGTAIAGRLVADARDDRV